MKNLVLFLFVLSLTACSTQDTFRYSSVDANNALLDQTDCAVNNVALVDDGMSDASSVAWALAQICSKEYRYASVVFASANLENRIQRRMFVQKRNEVSEKIENFLPYVMDYRISQKNK